MRSSTFIFWVLIVLSSCSQNIKNEEDVVTLDLKELTESKKFTLTDVFSDISVIPLENVKANMFNVIKMQKVGNYFFCISLNNTESKLLLFGEDGSFIRQIGERGHSKSEYLTIIDFAVDLEKKEVLILELNDKVKVYGFDGMFHYEITPEASFVSKIFSCPEGYYLLTEHYHPLSEDEYLIYCYDKDFNLKKKLLPFHEESRNMVYMSMINNVFYDSTNGKLMYFDEPLCQVYSISKESDDYSIKTYKFDLKNNYSYEEYIEGTPQFANKGKDMIRSLHFCENGMWVQYITDREESHLIYDFEKGQMVKMRTYGYFPGGSKCYSDGYYYSVVNRPRKIESYSNPLLNANGDIIKKTFGDVEHKYSEDDIIIVKMKFNPDFPDVHAVDVEAFEKANGEVGGQK